MTSSAEELTGIIGVIEHQKGRFETYRMYLWETIQKKHTDDEAMNEAAPTIDEIRFVENLVRQFATQVLGRTPSRSEWLSESDYARERERELTPSGSWVNRAYTHAGWTLRWLALTRVFVEYLLGGTLRVLEHQKGRFEAYHRYLWETIQKQHTDDEAQNGAPSIDEIWFVENLVRQFATQVLGRAPSRSEWLSESDYARERGLELTPSGPWAEGAYTQIGCTLRWLALTRGFVEYLDGVQSAKVSQP